MQKFLILGTETFAWNSSKRRELGQSPLFTYNMLEIIQILSEWFAKMIFSKVQNVSIAKLLHFEGLTLFSRVQNVSIAKLLHFGGLPLFSKVQNVS